MPRGTRSTARLTAIGRRVLELRGEGPQDDFARVLGISQSQLSKIERGKLAPSVEVLVRLPEKRGKSADWILREE